MTDVERPKSSRRRRWEVRSRESFETAIAGAINSPNRDIYHKGGPNSLNSASLRNKKLCKQNQREMFPEDENDTVSAKLSALLDEAQDISNNGKSHSSKLCDSEENLINSELNNYFDSNEHSGNPSAPPLSPVKSIKTPKKKVSVKVTPVHSGVNIINSKITEQLKHLSEDVVNNKHMNNESTIPAVAVSGLLIGPSSSTFNGNVSTIYCERLNNFVMANENQFLRFQNKPSQVDINKHTRKSHALFLQSSFRTFSILCQGLLAGLTIAHCIMIFLLQEGSDILLLQNGMEHTFYILIFILSAICLISAFDRCDIAGQGMFSEQGIRIPWTPLFYCISMTISLISIKAEDFITHYESEMIHYDKESVMYWWKFMCLSRTVFAVIAWIAVVTDPHTDALNSRISELSDD